MDIEEHAVDAQPFAEHRADEGHGPVDIGGGVHSASDVDDELLGHQDQPLMVPECLVGLGQTVEVRRESPDLAAPVGVGLRRAVAVALPLQDQPQPRQGAR